VRCLTRWALSVLLVLVLTSPVRSQDDKNAAPPQYQYFAGVVTALTATSVTVMRSVLGKSTTRAFAITRDTIIQGGKPRVRSKVTIKWIASDDGDRAVKIILRSPGPPPPKK